MLLDWWVVFSKPDLPVAKDIAGTRAAARVLPVSELVANWAEMWGIRRVGMWWRTAQLLL